MKYSKYTIRLREGFKRILIAVDKPVAAHAADIGMELSRELKAETALVYVINGTVDYMGHAGISSEQLIALAEQEGKQAPLSHLDTVARYRGCRRVPRVPHSVGTVEFDRRHDGRSNDHAGLRRVSNPDLDPKAGNHAERRWGIRAPRGPQAQTLPIPT